MPAPWGTAHLHTNTENEGDNDELAAAEAAGEPMLELREEIINRRLSNGDFKPSNATNTRIARRYGWYLR